MDMWRLPVDIRRFYMCRHIGGGTIYEVYIDEDMWKLSVDVRRIYRWRLCANI